MTIQSTVDAGAHPGYMVWRNCVFLDGFLATSDNCADPNAFDCEFHGRVVLVGYDSGSYAFDRCRFRNASVFAESNVCGLLRFRDCSFEGPTDTSIVAHSLGDAYVSFERCNFSGSSYGVVALPARYCDERLIIQSCSFTNLDRIAVAFEHDPTPDRATCVPLGLQMQDTRIVGCGQAIRWQTTIPGPIRVVRDTILSTRDTAIVADIRSADFDSLVIVESDGPGLALRVHSEPYDIRIHPRLVRVTGCTLQETGGVTVAYLGSGSGEPALDIRGNRVLKSSRSALRIRAPETTSSFRPWRVEANVLGRSRDSAVDIEAPHAMVVVRRNTLYLNEGDAVRLFSSDMDSIDHNIAYRNAGAAVHLVGQGAVIGGCNDWFGNRGVSGWGDDAPPAASDISLDPQFCDVGSDDVSLAAAPGLAAYGGCGAIGALGIGCQDAHADLSLARELDLRCRPQPAQRMTRFAWIPLLTIAELTVFDASGTVRWNTIVAPGVSTMEWSLIDKSGHSLRPGMYFARLRTSVSEGHSRLVIIR